jgi:hypothetical protein
VESEPSLYTPTPNTASTTSASSFKNRELSHATTAHNALVTTTNSDVTTAVTTVTCQICDERVEKTVYYEHVLVCGIKEEYQNETIVLDGKLKSLLDKINEYANGSKKRDGGGIARKVERRCSRYTHSKTMNELNIRVIKLSLDNFEKLLDKCGKDVEKLQRHVLDLQIQNLVESESTQLLFLVEAFINTATKKMELTRRKVSEVHQKEMDIARIHRFGSNTNNADMRIMDGNNKRAPSRIIFIIADFSFKFRKTVEYPIWKG